MGHHLDACKLMSLLQEKTYTRRTGRREEAPDKLHKMRQKTKMVSRQGRTILHPKLQLGICKDMSLLDGESRWYSQPGKTEGRAGQCDDKTCITTQADHFVKDPQCKKWNATDKVCPVRVTKV